MDVQGPDFIVSSLLSELKSENDRKDKLIKGLIRVICGCVLSILVIVAGFLWYLNQYDFTSTENVTATGVYAIVDSDGNVIAHDLTPEEIQRILGVLNDGQGSENSD